MSEAEQQSVSATPSDPVDFSDPTDADHAIRIGRAWTEMRRGAWTGRYQAFVFGDDKPIEPGQLDALDLLALSDRSMSQLAEKLRIDPSSATRAVQRLVADKLAERYAAPGDGRIVMVRITPSARARHSKISERRMAAMTHLLNGFSRDERGELANMLERFVAALDEPVRQR